MKTVCLYGPLGKEFGRVHRLDVAQPAEAIRALCANFPQFRQRIVRGTYRVLVGGKQALDKTELQDPISDRETLRIVPVVTGSGNVGKIVVGAALIYFSGGLAAGFGATGAAAGVAGAGAGVAGFAGITAATFSSIGVSLIVGGVASMLFAPKQTQGTTTDRPENKPSYTFDGAVNTAAQGNAIPALYGELICGSQVISAGLSADEYV